MSTFPSCIALPFQSIDHHSDPCTHTLDQCKTFGYVTTDRELAGSRFGSDRVPAGPRAFVLTTAGESSARRGLPVALDQTRVLELDLNLTADQAIAECRRRGLVVTSQRELAGRAGSRHWHLRIPSEVGTLELNEWQGRVWVKVHPLREGTWAADLARELAQLPSPA